MESKVRKLCITKSFTRRVNYIFFAAYTYPTSLKVGMTAAYALSFAVALIGNLVGLCVIRNASTVKSTTNLLIVNMAVADLMVALVVMPLSVSYLYIQQLWFGGLFGQITCKLAYYTLPMSIAASIFTLVVISIDRFFAVCHPTRQLNYARKPKVLTALIWFCASFLMLPFLFLFQVNEYDGGRLHVCAVQWSWDKTTNLAETRRIHKTFIIAQFILLYAAPLLFISFANFRVCRVLWLRKRHAGSNSDVRPKRENAKWKITRLLLAMVLVFALCWLPVQVIHYYRFVKSGTDHLFISDTAAFILLWVSHTNSAINPCLYIALNGNFRREFFKAVKMLFPVHRLRITTSSYRERALCGKTLNKTENVMRIRVNVFNPSAPEGARSLEPMKPSYDTRL